jgi:hypothetical protein
VVWSKNSVGRIWVRSEAQLGRALDKLVPISIEPCDIPLPYNGLHTPSLPREAAIDPAAPAIAAITQRARKAIDDAKRTRREPRIGEKLVRQLLIERAQLDPDAPGDFIETHKAEIASLRFYPLVIGRLPWRGQVNASIGYDREEEYIEEIGKPDPKGSGTVKVLEKRKRTVTDWKPHASQLTGVLDVSVPAIAANGDLAKALAGFSTVEAFALTELPESADVVKPVGDPLSLPSNLEELQSRIIAQATKLLPGDKKKDVKVTETFDTSQVRIVYLPIWSGSVGYAGKSIPLTASGLDGGDTIFEMPKDTELVTDRSRRESRGWMASGAGILAAAAGAGNAYMASWPPWLTIGSVPLLLVLAVYLAFWPSRDRSLARKIFNRETANVARLSRAAAAAGVQSDNEQMKAPVDHSGLGVRHILSWLASLAALGIAARLALQARPWLGL